jgi:hypothetical protein
MRAPLYNDAGFVYPRSHSNHVQTRPLPDLQMRQMRQAGQGHPAKVSACSHIQPYQGICAAAKIKRHATGNPDAVKSFVESNDGNWHHHH